MEYVFPAFTAQTYVGRKRAAVDRICVGVPAGEVKSLSSFTAWAAAVSFICTTQVFLSWCLLE